MQMRVGSMRTCIRGDKSVDVIGTPILGHPQVILSGAAESSVPAKFYPYSRTYLF